MIKKLMRRYNQKLLDAMFEICEKEGAITEVGPEYYKAFLDMSPKGSEVLIKCIVCESADLINNNVFSGNWTREEDISDHIGLILDMMSLGIMGVEEEKGHLVFSKPVGDPPNASIQEKLDEKIKSTIPIIRKVILELLDKESTHT